MAPIQQGRRWSGSPGLRQWLLYRRPAAGVRRDRGTGKIESLEAPCEGGSKPARLLQGLKHTSRGRIRHARTHASGRPQRRSATTGRTHARGIGSAGDERTHAHCGWPIWKRESEMRDVAATTFLQHLQ
eukprot:4347181-Pleurochrysis_carterae.AAC.1